ncbi:MAG: hypothetical protein JOZ22_09920 [Acidobacteriia bacterium]|nr:hypothetical protein [Terriglobia bacterium]
MAWLFAVISVCGQPSGSPPGSRLEAVPATEATPLYLYSHFRDDDDRHLYLDYSRDALHWTEIAPQGLSPRQSLISNQTLGSVRTDGPYCAGIQITIGAKNVTVTDLGRWVQAGNTQSHQMVLEDSSGNILTSGNLATAGQSPGDYAYVSIPPTTLSAGGTYYILSQEYSSGDGWYDALPVASSPAATIEHAAWQSRCGSGPVNPYVRGSAYGPVNFIYQAPLKKRDSSIMRSNGQFHFLVTSSYQAQIPYFHSTDLKTFSTPRTIDLGSYIPGATVGWAPEWQRAGGNTYFWIAVNSSNNPFGPTRFMPYLFAVDPSTGDVLSSPEAIALNGTTMQRTFDFFPWTDGSLYYVFYVDQQPTATVSQPIAYATATSLTGPYTQQTPRNADYFGFGGVRGSAEPVRGILSDGDSITFGFGLANPASQAYLSQALTPLPANWAAANAAASGLTSAQLLKRLDSAVLPKLTAWGKAQLVYTVMAGTEDFQRCASGTCTPTASATYANIQSMCSAVRNATGASIIVFTLPPANLSANSDSFESFRQDLNGLIRNGGSCSYTVADVGSDGLIGQPKQWSNVYYYEPDGIHLTRAGQAIIADYLNTALKGLPAPPAPTDEILNYQTEAPTLVALPNGCVRIIVDTWVYTAWGSRKYTPYYKDSCPSLGPLFSQASLVPPQNAPPLPIHITAAEHGTITTLTDNSSAAVVYAAAADQ